MAEVNLDPRGMVGRIYEENYKTILKLWALWFWRRRFFYVLPIVSLWELSVAMETKNLIQSAPKPKAVNPPTH